MGVGGDAIEDAVDLDDLLLHLELRDGEPRLPDEIGIGRSRRRGTREGRGRFHGYGL